MPVQNTLDSIMECLHLFEKRVDEGMRIIVSQAIRNESECIIGFFGKIKSEPFDFNIC